MRTVLVLMAYLVGAGPANASNEKLRALVVEFKTFQGAQEFRRLGLRVGGPFHPWLEAVTSLNNDKVYSKKLLDRCGSVPLDLYTHATYAMAGEVNAFTLATSSKFDRCITQ